MAEVVRTGLQRVPRALPGSILQGSASSRRTARAVGSAGRGSRGAAAAGSHPAAADRSVHSTHPAPQLVQTQVLEAGPAVRTSLMESGS